MDSRYTTLALYARAPAHLSTSAGEAEDASRALEGQAPLARGPRPHGARLAALVPFYEYDEKRFFRSDDAPEEIALAARRASCVSRSCSGAQFAKTTQLTDEIRDSISDLQFTDRLPRAVPVQPARAPASQGRRVPAVVVRRHGHRPRRQRVLRPDRLLRRQCVRLRLLQAVHRPRASSRRAISGRCWAPTTRWSPTTCGGCARFPGWTRSRSTCPAPRRSCRRCGWRAITRGARIWCASAAPTTAGGATCSRASAIRCPRARPTRSRTCTRTLRVLRTRRDIACVLVNPLQALHPNANAPSDSTLVDSGRRAHFDRAAYTEWLRGCARSAPARHRADLRRGVRRLPPRARRRAGILRRARRHGHLRQDAGRRAAGRRAVRPHAT